MSSGRAGAAGGAGEASESGGDAGGPGDGSAAGGSLRPRLAVLAAAVLFSTGGAAIKATDLGAWEVAGLRSAFAAAFLWFALPRARRRPNSAALAVAAAYAATLALFVAANKLTTAANTIFLQSTAPLYVLALAPWLLGERVRRRELAYMAALAVGLAMFFVGQRPPDALAPDPLLGNVLAAVSGLTWALTLLGLRALGRGGQAEGEAGRGAAGEGEAVAEDAAAAGAGPAAVLAGNLFAFAVGLPMALPVARVELADLALLAFLGVFQIALAYAFLTRALRRVGAFEASLLLLVEPVLNPVWVWLVHGEQPGRWGLAGGVVILAATLVKTAADARRAGAAPRP
jgi:drug/metabolite transporter (DMT)-like permease